MCAAKAPLRIHRLAGLSEPWLFADTISRPPGKSELLKINFVIFQPNYIVGTQKEPSHSKEPSQ